MSRREGGASILELALITPMMVLIVMGVVDLTRAYRMQIQLENAAREGAAYAQINPNRVSGCTDGDPSIRDRILAENDGLSSFPDFDILVLAPGGSEMTGCDGTAVESGERVEVEVSASFDVLTPVVERVVADQITITGSAELEAQGEVEPPTVEAET